MSYNSLYIRARIKYLERIVRTAEQEKELKRLKAFKNQQRLREAQEAFNKLVGYLKQIIETPTDITDRSRLGARTSSATGIASPDLIVTMNDGSQWVYNSRKQKRKYKPVAK